MDALVDDRIRAGAQPLRVLMLEDAITDAELNERALGKAGLAYVAKRVEHKAAFIEALESFRPDVILCDYTLPDFNGADALKHVRAVHPEVPVVMVTGTLGDEAAIELLKAGAKDYVLKNNLIRLPSAAQRAISIEQGIAARKSAERALRRSEERYRTLVTATAQLVWTTDANGQVSDDLPLWRAFTGQSADEVRGGGWAAALHPDDRAAAVAAWREAVANGALYKAEYRVRRHDGVYRTMAAHAVPVKEADGSVREWIGTCTDITERQQAEARLREEEAKFRGLVEQNVAGIMIIRQDARIAYINPYWAKLNGYTADETIGHPVFDYIPEPERPRVEAELARQFAGGGFTQLETTMLAKDGRVVDILVNASPGIYEGEPASIAVLLDITERRRAQQQLQASEERFRLIVEEAPDAILLFDCDRNRFVSANQAAERLFGCGRDEIIRHGPQHFYPPEQPDSRPVSESFEDHNRKALAGEALRYERRILNAGGEERLCEVTLVRLPSPDIRLLRASYVDVTERHRIEQELVNANIIVEQSPVVLFRALAQPGFPRVYMSRNVSRFGYTAEEAKAGAFVFPDYVHPEDLPRVQAALDRLVGGGSEIFELDYRIFVRDGSVRWLHDRTMPLHDDKGRIWAFQGILIDITERKEAERALDRLNRTLRTLSRGNEVVVRATDENELVREMCRTIVEAGGYRMAWVGRVDQDPGKSVVPLAWAGETGEYIAKAHITWADEPRGNGPHGRAIRSGEPQITRDLGADPSMAPWRDEAARCGFAGSIVLPLKDATGVFAVLMIYAGEPDAFDAAALKLLGELAGDLAYGIQALRHRAEARDADQRWRRSLEATVGAIASTVEMRDPYTAGHQQRVARLAVAIAREVQLPEQQIEGLYLAGIIHDVGKISIPAEILSTPAKLSPVQYQLIQTHAQAGYEIIKGVDFPWPIGEIVRQHHERLDGSGYPRALKGNAMLPEAKILAVADVVEAMMSHRPYRPSRGIEAAFAELERGKGTIYDPIAVEACIALLRAGRCNLE